jgi:hypothetical protein
MVLKRCIPLGGLLVGGLEDGMVSATADSRLILILCVTTSLLSPWEDRLGSIAFHRAAVEWVSYAAE